MGWFDVIKNKNNKLAQEAYSTTLDIIDKISEIREGLLDDVERIANGPLMAHLNMEDARNATKGILSSLFKDLEEKEKSLKEDLEFYMKEGMK